MILRIILQDGGAYMAQTEKDGRTYYGPTVVGTKDGGRREATERAIKWATPQGIVGVMGDAHKTAVRLAGLVYYVRAPGAGRPALDPSKRRVKITEKVRPDVAEGFRERAKAAGTSVGKQIDLAFDMSQQKHHK